MRVRILQRTLALCTLLLAPAAPALAQEGEPQEPADEQSGQSSIEIARGHMEAGNAYFLQQRFDEAAEEFLRAYAQQPFGAFLFNAAVAYEHERQWSRAADHFARYLEQEPNAVDRLDVAARIDRLRTRARGAEAQAPGDTTGTDSSEVAATGTDAVSDGASEGTGDEGTVDPDNLPDEVQRQMKSLAFVETEPAGANVKLFDHEGQLVAEGPSPFVETIAAGQYRFVVEHPDYAPRSHEFRAFPGLVFGWLTSLPLGVMGYLRVITDMPGANVFVDDRAQGALGRTPYYNSIPVGEHRIWIEKPGYEMLEVTVDVGAGGEVTTVQELLTRVTHGRLRVVSNVRDATVFVDGQEVGTVPFEGQVEAGAHTVRIEADGMKDWEQTITLERGQVTPVRVRLRPAVSRGGAWATTTISALLLGGGIVLGVLSERVADDLRADSNAGHLASNDSRFLEGQLLAVGADVAFGASAVLGVLSIYYFLRDPLPESEGRALEPRDWALSPALSPTGFGASLTGRL